MRRFRLIPTLVLVTLLSMLSTAHAEIYKWVDENGKTHYSETRPDSAKVKTLELKSGAPQPTSAPQVSASSARSWQEQERLLKHRQAEEAIARASRPAESGPRSVSGGRSDGTDASRCALARDVLNGSLRHSNGAPIDKNDIDIARSDIRNFCH